jgi:methyl-accepting chemotaxis protein
LDIATSLAQFECNISSIVAEAIDKTARLDAIADALSMEAAATNEKLAYANEVSDLIVKRIEKAGEILREVLTSMSALGNQGSGTQEAATGAIARNREASHAIVGAVAKIDPIIGVISKVAAQTNLLALNARIEAARAGEFGKGFAVIATEVKTLAVQTATATEEISAQIAAIEKASALSAENIELSCRTIDEIASLGQAMTSAVGEQGDATRRINRNISDAARFAHAAGDSITAMVTFNEQTRQIAAELRLLSKSLGTGMMEVRTKAAGIRS